VHKLILLGCGRIGQVHAKSVLTGHRARLVAAVDPVEAAARTVALEAGCQAFTDPAAALDAVDADGVLICTSTDTHVAMIRLAASKGLATFCEKPVDLDRAEVVRCLADVDAAGVPLMMGFNRRFDPSFRALKARLDDGEVGKLEVVRITSRDPEPPPAEYAKVSGGLFRDMMIHDFDTARWLLGDEPVELYAQASCLIDPAIGEAGDVDTAVVVMKTASGVLCQIDNSRRAAYGYDQRIEVLGERGMLQANNPQPTTVVRTTAAGEAADKPPWFFLERYADAYRAELDAFLDVLEGGAPPVTGHDGLRALLLAEAANDSLESRRAVRVE
jgi:myo-inositol 2-dehydrogenase/D-chiro-inositol 1-dehydrogenase